MKIFVAGASGAIGRSLVPQLVVGGHEVVASTSRRDGRWAIAERGATPVVVDGLDRKGMLEAVVAAEPEVVVHEMTRLAGVTDFRRYDDAFATTNRLRTAGTDHLAEAARAAGACRVVAQSFGNWNYERRGGPGTSFAAHVLPALLIMGVGFGSIVAPAIASATYGVDPRDSGVASAMVNTMQQVGGSIGTAVLSSIFASAVTSYMDGMRPTPQLAGDAAIHGYSVAFWVAAGIFAVGAVVVGGTMRSVRVEPEPVAEPLAA